MQPSATPSAMSPSSPDAVSPLDAAVCDAEHPPTLAILQMPQTQNSSADHPILPKMASKGKGKRLNEFQRLEIIDKLKMSIPPSKRALARQYEVSEGAIRKVWENRDSILSRSTLMSEEAKLNTYRASVGRFSHLEDTLFIWIETMRRASLPLPPSLVITKAKRIAEELQLSDNDFKASWQWLSRFKARKGFSRFTDDHSTDTVAQTTPFHGFAQLDRALLEIEDQLLSSEFQTEAGGAYDDIRNLFESLQRKVNHISTNVKRRKCQNACQMTLHDMVRL